MLLRKFKKLPVLRANLPGAAISTKRFLPFVTLADTGRGCRLNRNWRIPAMPATSILFGLALIGYGIFLYFDTDQKSPTALIPAGFGAAFLLLGLLASWKESLRKHAMHAAAATGLIGCLGGLAMGLPKLKMFTGEEPQRPAAVQAQVWLGVLCGLFVLMCVKSFIDARAARKSAGNQKPSA
jgi:peptidoglycan/LPS O-acetylase OafA/YrhL